MAEAEHGNSDQHTGTDAFIPFSAIESIIELTHRAWTLCFRCLVASEGSCRGEGPGKFPI